MVPGIKKVIIKNYKSIAQSSVELEPLSVFVGPNGAGKSNFFDALAFVQECLSDSVELAFKNRGGIASVRRISPGHPTNIGIRVIIDFGSGSSADYAFEIAARQDKRFTIKQERCAVKGFMEEDAVFDIRDGVFTREIPGIRPKISTDRLALYAASATEAFRPVYDFLTSMRFYSIVPGKLRELQEPDPGNFLKHDGSNSAAVLKNLNSDPIGKSRYDRLCRLLSRVVEGVSKVEYKAFGQKETLQFKQNVGQDSPWTFDAWNMSDGTLRVLGLFLAVYQRGTHSLVAIEEPEATVHPAVAEIIIEVILKAAKERQIILTTHSPDILDYKSLTDGQIRVVIMKEGKTIISPISISSREAIKEHLYTPGELLRINELNPDLVSSQNSAKQLKLFGPIPTDQD